MKTFKNKKSAIGKLAEKGFTLVELLIVVIILAILAAIVVPQFASTTNDARDSAADSTLAGLRAAIDLYYQQHGEYPGVNTSTPTAACGGTPGDGALDTSDAVMQQLSRFTDADGGACSVSDDTNHKFGPYLKKLDIPADPYNTVAAMAVVPNANALSGDLGMIADADPGPGGFKYDPQTGKILINLRAQEAR